MSNGRSMKKGGGEMRSYQELDEFISKGRSKQERKIRYATRAERTPYGIIALFHHDTSILCFYPDGSIVIDCDGWRSMTTKDRLNTHLPERFGVYQEGGVWYLTKREPLSENISEHLEWVYQDGMVIHPDGTVEGGLPVESAVEIKKQRKQVREYVKGYVSALLSGDVPAPGPGDCWLCVLRSEGEIFSDTDHLLSHIEEGYYVPRLLVRAIEVFPVSVMAEEVLGWLWHSENEWAMTYQATIASEQLASSLKRYMYRQLEMPA